VSKAGIEAVRQKRKRRVECSASLARSARAKALNLPETVRHLKSSETYIGEGESER
jgi:hypothetical protein